MTITREDIRRQLDLEAEARGLGAVRYRQSRPLPWRSPEDAPSVDEEANLPPGQQLLRLAVEPTAALIREKLEAAAEGKAGRRHSALGWLEIAQPEEVAYLAARVALNSAASRASFQSATRSLGEHIMDHVRMLTFKKENAAGYVGLMRSAKTGRVSIVITYNLYAKAFAEQGFASPFDVAAIIMGPAPSFDMWAVDMDQPVGDESLFTRIA